MALVQIKVLSVDDDPVNQMVVQTLLTSSADITYDVTQAMNGEEALEILADKDNMPDVILLDVMMPGMSGHEVCRKLRAMYPLHCIPVIMVSAKSKEEHVVEGLMAGSNDYLVKPFGRHEMLARISAHLRFKDTVIDAATQRSASASSEISSMLLQPESQLHSLPEELWKTADAGNSMPMQVRYNLNCQNLSFSLSSPATSLPTLTPLPTLSPLPATPTGV